MTDQGSFQKFVDLLELSSDENQWIISKDTQLILQSIYSKLGVVLVFGKSTHFYSFCRKMLLNIFNDQQKHVQIPLKPKFALYKQVQIGLTKFTNKPIEWIYIEHHFCEQTPIYQKLLQLAFFVPSYILYKIETEFDCQQLLSICKAIKNSMKDICDDFAPELVLIGPKESPLISKIVSQVEVYFKVMTIFQQNQPLCNANIAVSLSEIDQTTKKGKMITECMLPKVFDNQFISPKSLIQLINKLSTFTLNKTLSMLQLSPKRVETQPQSTSFSHHCQDSTLIENQNTNRVLQWGKQLLNGEYKSIDRKLRTREIKSVATFKQQLVIFRAFFLQKTQNCQSQNLTQYYEQFIFNKIFQGVTQIIQKQMEYINQREQNYAKINQQLQQNNKELKKKLKIDNNSHKYEFNQLQQKLLQQSIIINQLEYKVEQLQLQLRQKQEQQMNKGLNLMTGMQVHKIQQEQQIDKLKESLKQQAIKTKIVNSEVQKQQSLRQELVQHYEIIIRQMRSKELQLNSQIVELTTDQTQAKSTTYLDETDDLLKQKNRYMEKLGWQLSNKNAQVQALKDSIVKMEQNYGEKMRLLIANREQEINQGKKLQQKLIDYESRELKYKQLQTDLERVHNNWQQELVKCRLMQKQRMLAEQHCEFLQQQSQEQIQKYRQLMLQIQTNKYQTHKDVNINTKIQQALKIVDIIKMEYRHIKQELQSYRNKSSLVCQNLQLS